MCEPVYHKNFMWYMTNNIKKKNSETLMNVCNFRSTIITISLTSYSTSSAGAKRVKKYNHAVARAHIGTRYNI